MRTGLLLTVVLACGLAALPAQAGGARSVTVRLVEASNAIPGDSKGIEDVTEILKKSVVYTRFQMVDSIRFLLPANGEAQTLVNYQISCKGQAANLEIVVLDSRKKELLRTEVRLREGKPLILGGFPAGEGKHLLVFVVH